MADFCRQCTQAIFGEDESDLAGITKPEHEAQGLYAIVLCEGCGPIQVDTEGRCISSDCFENHGDKNASTEVH